MVGLWNWTKIPLSNNYDTLGLLRIIRPIYPRAHLSRIWTMNYTHLYSNNPKSIIYIRRVSFVEVVGYWYSWQSTKS
jgi:hypothetical protein